MWEKITASEQLSKLSKKKDYIIKYDVSGKIQPDFENATIENIMTFVVIENNSELEELQLGILPNYYKTYIQIGLEGFVSKPLNKKYQDLIIEQLWWHRI